MIVIIIIITTISRGTMGSVLVLNKNTNIIIILWRRHDFPDRKNLHRGGLVTIKQSSRATLSVKKIFKTSRVIITIIIIIIIIMAGPPRPRNNSNFLRQSICHVFVFRKSRSAPLTDYIYTPTCIILEYYYNYY